MRDTALIPLLEALLPSVAMTGAGQPTAPEVASRMAALHRRLPFFPRIGLRLAVAWVDLAPALLLIRCAGFRALSLEQRREVLARCFATRVTFLRDLGTLLRAVTFAVYYDDPRVTAALGWFVEDHIAQVNASPPAVACLTTPGRRE